MIHLVFPGQGSQQPQMGRFLFDNFTLAKDLFEEASDAIGVDMKKLCFEGSEQDLALTANTQPALLLVSTATQRVMRSEFEFTVASAAGHSIGEYAALVAAKSLRFSDAMKAVRARGIAMQEAVPVGQGGMFAVLGLDMAQVQFVCDWVKTQSKLGPLSPANDNCPGQIVISGHQAALNWLKENFKPELIPGQPKRAKLIPLAVSAPFHCSMMAPAEEKMRLLLTATPFHNAEFPVIQNFTAQPVTQSVELRENLIRQISAPVRWTETMQSLAQTGSHKVLECGAGKVLSGLFKKMPEPTLQVYNVNSMEDLKNFEEFLKASSH